MELDIVRPVLVYDGDCTFCRRWIARWRHVTQGRVDYVSSQEAARQLPQISQEQFQTSVQLVLPDGKVYDGAQAVFRALAYNPKHRWPLWLYRNAPGTAPATEFAYRFVARNRGFFSLLTRGLWGESLEPSTWFLTRRVFLALLGAIYCIAFASLWMQIDGLLGSRGILPVQEFLENVKQIAGAERYGLLPTVFWMNASDAFLNAVCLAGVVLSVGVMAGFGTGPALVLLWLLYLSLLNAGREFMAFQWDVLLLEAGFLAIFMIPWQRRRKLAREAAPSPVALFLLRFLLFRVMFSSGIAKLASGDETWRNGTALNFHYETQPLPTWGGWYAHQLPAWFQEFSVLCVLAIQLVVPFFIFAPRRLLHWACAALVLFQFLIIITGNYAFFNLLTLALCLVLLDDAFYKKVLPGKFTSSLGDAHGRFREGCIKQWVVGFMAAGVLFVSVTCCLIPLMFRGVTLPAISQAVYGHLRPFHLINPYGLFAVMTTRRPEIIVQGSNDALTWKTYEFKWKPGDVTRAPAFVAPYQPRLDWQMWFAALGSYRENPWILQFLKRLLEGAKPVLQLLASNPFPDKPPQYVRAVVYEYRFTDFSGWREEGSWWRREGKGFYTPVLQLSDF